MMNRELFNSTLQKVGNIFRIADFSLNDDNLAVLRLRREGKNFTIFIRYIDDLNEVVLYSILFPVKSLEFDYVTHFMEKNFRLSRNNSMSYAFGDNCKDVILQRRFSAEGLEADCLFKIIIDFGNEAFSEVTTFDSNS